MSEDINTPRVVNLVSEEENILSSFILSRFCDVACFGQDKTRYYLTKNNFYEILWEVSLKCVYGNAVVNLNLINMLHQSIVQIDVFCVLNKEKLCIKKWNVDDLHSKTMETSVEQTISNYFYSGLAHFPHFYQELSSDLKLDVRVIRRDGNNIFKLSDDLHGLLQSGDHYDFVFKFGNKEMIKAHKLILVTRNPTFAKMIECDMLEKKNNSVDIEGIDVDVFKLLLYYIYTGKEGIIDATKIYDLLVAADRYGIKELMMICQLNILKNLNVDNAAENLVFADNMQLQNLKAEIMDFILTRKHEVMKSIGYKDMEKEKPHLVTELIEKMQLKSSWPSS